MCCALLITGGFECNIVSKLKTMGILSMPLLAFKNLSEKNKTMLMILVILWPVLFRDLWFRMNDLYPRKLWAATVHYMCANRQAQTFFPSKVTQVKHTLPNFDRIFSRRYLMAESNENCNYTIGFLIVNKFY